MPLLAAYGSAALLAACGGGGTPAPAAPALSPAAALGEKIFKDASLSASGRMSCATCHAPAAAHAQTNDLAVQLGGPGLDVAGFRAVPSLRYLGSTPAFFFAKDGTATGGFNRDGSADSLLAQAARPFLAAHEMANGDAKTVVDKLARASYAADFRKAFGDNVLVDPDAAFLAMRHALQRYQLENTAEFAPFTSKYDAFLAGQLKLSDPELRGLALFNNSAKGNCAACHPSARGSDGSAPLFTDFSFDNLGVPRNTDIPATADAGYFDLGLCQASRPELAARSDLCGAFKVPTLRNVATRRAFFHNGRFKTLREALRFYVTRDTNPELWYPVVNGLADKFNDLPPAYRANVNTSEVPYNRKPGDAPALSDAEIEDLLAFLATLSDGYAP
ncbi:cytochrome-c peroxidase [Roseateles saccharophilus]|uniref:cytochrome-c peroxidase n=1 Tax=Roseateles saccharophilus TaxID=304 RepID=UPI001FB4D4AE|nr:cytochrome c peroxidase [Roseateles saccharophilus]